MKKKLWKKKAFRDWDEEDLRNAISSSPTNVILFPNYMLPHGGLTQDRESHALFFYFLHARKMYEECNLETRLVYEGDKDPAADFYALFKSVAIRYNVNPEKMAKFWPHVDYTCQLHSMPKLPDERRFRCDFKPEEIITNANTKSH